MHRIKKKSKLHTYVHEEWNKHILADMIAVSAFIVTGVKIGNETLLYLPLDHF